MATRQKQSGRHRAAGHLECTEPRNRGIDAQYNGEKRHGLFQMTRDYTEDVNHAASEVLRPPEWDDVNILGITTRAPSWLDRCD